jgi:hypothetical protein
MKPFSVPAVIVASAVSLSAIPASADELSDLITSAKPIFNLRYRYEYVDQDGLPFNANASTLRVHAGVKTGQAYGFSAMAEVEMIAHLASGNYNDTINGLGQYPVVADPATGVLNQAVVTWSGAAGVSLSGGRQAVNLDNQRFIGSVGWRQNDQVLDIASAAVTPIEGLTAYYGYSWRVHRIFGPDSPQGIWRDSDINLFNAGYDAGAFGKITAYAYFLDIKAAPLSSSKTAGARWSGKVGLGGVTALWAAEFARQYDFGSNPLNYSLDYVLLEPGISALGATLKFGYEWMSGNGVAAFQTPLATLHAFDGWADKFLTTPATGIEDLYGDLVYKVGGTTLRVVYHDFSSTTGGLHYGTEWDALAAHPIGKHLTVTLKFADYRAKAFATDTTKAWVMLDIH